MRGRADEVGQQADGRCTLYLGTLENSLSSQKSKLQLVGNVRLTLSTSPTFANKLLAVLHFPSGESVLIHLGTFLAPSHLLRTHSSLAKEGKEQRKEGREGGRKKGREGSRQEGWKEGKKQKSYLKILLAKL